MDSLFSENMYEIWFYGWMVLLGLDSMKQLPEILFFGGGHLEPHILWYLISNVRASHYLKTRKHQNIAITGSVFTWKTRTRAIKSAIHSHSKGHFGLLATADETPKASNRNNSSLVVRLEFNLEGGCKEHV